VAIGSIEKPGWTLKPSQVIWKLSDRARQAKQEKKLNPDAALGKRGEDLAHRYLQRAGYAVVARNYKPGADSEIDIIAQKGDLYVFVEVKARKTDEFGAPERAVDKEKQKHILRAARAYATRAGIEWNQVRFDIISIVFSKPPAIWHQQDAFFSGRV
jgi:putative endonuclease